MKFIKIILTATISILSLNIFSQEIPISLIDRINQVDYIFEGKVIESNSYEVNNSKTIYTSNTIEVYKVFKGNINCGTIELICDGGIVGDKRQNISHTLNLRKGQMGVFFGNTTNKQISQIDFFPETNLEKLEATFQNQSLVKYWFDGNNYKASDLWYKYDSIAEFYNFAEQIIGYSYVDCNNSAFLKNNTIKPKSTNNFLISLIYPLTVNGGVRDTLNIKGLNFGNARGNGNVYFKNADDGGQSEIFLDSADFIQWSDTLIKVYVPSIDTMADSLTYPHPAGTGPIRIVLDNGDEETSDDIVKIHYSVFNGDSKDITYLYSYTGNDRKYTFHCDTSVANFSNGEMKAVIKRALLDWSCLTGINWELGSDTFGIVSGDDKLNVIVFSNSLSDSLSNTTAAATAGYYRECLGESLILESDIIINRNLDFFFDTINNAHLTDSTDFYHAILHELGHAHILNHVIDLDAIMHYNEVSTRSIDLRNDLSCDDGGNFIMDTSIVKDLICGGIDSIYRIYPVTGCDFSPTSINRFSLNELDIKIFPNPTDNNINLIFNDNIEKNIEIHNIQGEIIATKIVKQSKITLDFNDYSNGIYFIKITELSKNKTYKVVKK